MEWLNYNHLYYFWKVLRAGGLTRACEELRLAPPTVSAQLRRLEHQLGEKLLTKVGRRLVPTEMGQVAFRYADQIFSLGQELMDALKQRSTDKPLRLVVGVDDVLPKEIAQELIDPALRLPKPVVLRCHEANLEALMAKLAIHVNCPPVYALIGAVVRVIVTLYDFVWPGLIVRDGGATDTVYPVMARPTTQTLLASTPFSHCALPNDSTPLGDLSLRALSQMIGHHLRENDNSAIGRKSRFEIQSKSLNFCYAISSVDALQTIRKGQSNSRRYGYRRRDWEEIACVIRFDFMTLRQRAPAIGRKRDPLAIRRPGWAEVAARTGGDSKLFLNLQSVLS